MATEYPDSIVGRCSVLGRAAGEVLPGTAATTGSWLVVEDPGPWGRDALTESTLPPAAVAHLAAQAEASGARVQLVRNPDRTTRADARRVLYADAGRPSRLRDLGLHDDESLTRLDLADGELRDGAVYLVCTHAKRDACCAVFGRPLIGALRATTQADVWETSHTGGHRFAGVTVVLPWGLTYGRLTPEDVPQLVAATSRHEILLDRYRGRSCDPHPVQAADVALRRRTGVLGIDDVEAEIHTMDDDTARALVSVKGHDHEVVLERVSLGEQRPPSCGKDDEPIVTWQVRSVELVR